MGNVTDKTVILIDDLADTATTLARASRLVKKEGATMIYALAFLTTLYRLFVRVKIGRWGWDDSWVVLAAVCAAGAFPALWVAVAESMPPV